MKQEKLIKSCSSLLYKLCNLVESCNSLNFYDINISSESFFIPILNMIYDCDLQNINIENKNAAAIDLGDKNGKLAVQVTSDSSAKKIHNTLKKYREYRLYKQYDRLIILVIKKKRSDCTDYSQDIKGEFNFSKKDDIIAIDSLVQNIRDLSIEKINSIHEYLEFSLESRLDNTQVLSIEQEFDDISQNTDNILNESFFEIDHDVFIADFREKLSSSEIIHVSSLSIEEGKFCILNLLHKICPDTHVYTIKSKDTWNKAKEYLEGCILIPYFTAAEIPAIKNNKTIIIHTSDYCAGSIKLPRRTLRFLSNKLQENGYDDPYDLLQKTNGLYYYIKLKLFTGSLCLPMWEEDNNKAVIVAALLGKWTECDEDKAAIEHLYGNAYETFIEYLRQYEGVEDAFIIRKRNNSYTLTYELADPYITICSHEDMVDFPIVERFFTLVKSVFLYTDPTNELIAYGEIRYSVTLIMGMLRTLILLAICSGIQNKINSLVKDLLSPISSIEDWVYISPYIELLGEASPDAMINCFEKHIDNSTGLLDLFTCREKAGDCYTHVLWCLEKLLSSKDYAVCTVKILFYLGERIDNCSFGNNPKDVLSGVFRTWYNMAALSVEDKIELAKFGVKKYTYFWDILYDEIWNKDPILVNSSYVYREDEKITSCTRRRDFTDSYIKILFDNINESVPRIIKVFDLLPHCREASLFTEIIYELYKRIGDLSDPEKEKIKTSLRRIIYDHRRYVNAKWAATSERLTKIEELCLGITFEDPVYDFLYLTGSGVLPILHPVVYDHENKDDNNALEIEKTIDSEFNRLKDSEVSLGKFLSLCEIHAYNQLGIHIAKYYCDSKFDEAILDIILNTTNNFRVAIDYVYGCIDSNTTISSIIESLHKNHFADEFYIAFLSTLQLDRRTIGCIQNLPKEAEQKYWSLFSRIPNGDEDLINYVIENLLKYQNWNQLLFILYKKAEIFNTEDIITAVSNCVEKKISDHEKISHNECFYIEELLKKVYQKIGNDFESYPQLFEIEKILLGYSHIEWTNMKCSQYLFKRNANYYADILEKIIYYSNQKDEKFQSRLLYYLNLKREAEFCPGEENGSINEVILNEWIKTFYYRLKKQGQERHFQDILGNLFSFSPIGKDGLFPHESIREKIEEIGDDDMIRSFAISVLCSRGAYWATEGKDEYKLAQKYKQLSKAFEIYYPKTSKAFNILSSHYMGESERERRNAENYMF